MYRALAVPCYVGVVKVGQRRKPREARGTHVLTSREECVCWHVVVDILAMNGVLDGDKVLWVSQGHRL